MVLINFLYLLRPKILHLTFINLYSNNIDLTTILNNTAISEIKSTLSTASSTSFLNRVEHNITFRSDPYEIESQPTLVSSAPTELTNLQPKSYKEKGINYIKVLLKPEGKKAITA